ncbi:STAS domain-containing protein [Micromonospora fulviviridis]|uniref:STAS domain-containing protein n=1 Tax=Micromonospora fulviviridis TaxID=47860 RepID=UPI0037B45605
MKITRCLDGQGVARLALTGELDIASVDAFHEQVQQALASDRPNQLIIDLAALTFCDSTGIRALVDARATVRARAVAFQVVNPRGVTRRVMRVTGVLDVLTAV